MPAAFTATLNWDDGETGSVAFGDDGVVRHRGLVSDIRILDSTDPRFSGTGNWIASLDQRDELGLVFNAAFRFENEAGAWQEVPHIWFRREGLVDFSPVTSVLVGDGAYLLVLDEDGLRSQELPGGGDLVFGPDGHAWSVADGSLYVITPEAVKVAA